MTATDFTTAVTVWTGAALAAAAVVFPAYTILVGRIKAAVEQTKALHAQSTARLDQHDAIAGVVTSPAGPVNAVAGKQPLTVASPVLEK